MLKRETIVHIQIMPWNGLAALHTDGGHTLEISMRSLLHIDGPVKGGILLIDTDKMELAGYEAPNAEVTGSPALSASPCGLPGYAGGDK